MTKEQVRKQLIENITTIGNLTSQNAELTVLLEQLELEDWQPNDGDFKVGPDGLIYPKNLFEYIHLRDLEFGSVRTTKNRALMASRNMKIFNRLSCYMDDSNPVIEFSDMCVKLVFYDYDSYKVKKLKKILEVKGKL